MLIEKLLKAKWWKLLGAAIMIYVLVVGLCIPLKPGLLSISQLTANTGEITKIQITGYNTKFAEADNKVWFKLGKDYIYEVPQDKIVAVNDNVLEFAMYLPQGLPVKDKSASVTLITDNAVHGTAILPNAMFIKGNGNTDATGWNAKITGIHKIEGIRFPFRNILEETVRNTFFHVAIWMAMFTLLIMSLVFAIRYLWKSNIKDDIISSAIIYTAVLFGVLGLVTGSVWAKMTWGTWWTNDIKLNMATVAMLIYLAYVILRMSIQDIDRRAQISAGYAIFAFVAMIPLVFILPRMTDSLHPGNGGNPALGGEDLDNTLRMVFYPAGIGLTLIGLWISSILIRIGLIKEQLNDIKE